MATITRIYRIAPDAPRATVTVDLVDGRKLHVNTQYGVVGLYGHQDDCPMLNRIGGECICIPDVDTERVVQMGRDWLRSQRISLPMDVGINERQLDELAPSNDNPYMTQDTTRPCSICHTYCYGDCRD